MASFLTEIATAVPGSPHDQAEIASLLVEWHGLEADRARRLRALFRTSGIRTRHSCLTAEWYGEAAARSRPRGTRERLGVYERAAPELAERAVRALFDGAPGVDPRSIDHVFLVSCTGMMAPGIDVELTRRLPLRADVGRSVIGFQGCQGGLTALRLADGLCRAAPQSRCLVVCVELCSLHFQSEPTDENFLGNALFADGAAAVLVEGASSAPHSRGLRIDATRTLLVPGDASAMRWIVGDAGFELRLSAELPRLIGTSVRQAFEDFVLPGAGEVSWAVHPGGPAILDAVERAFELAPEALGSSREVLRRYGNMSSPTVFFVLEHVMASRRNAESTVVGSGQGPAATPAIGTPIGGARPIVAMSFGPGLSVEAVRLSPVA